MIRILIADTENSIATMIFSIISDHESEMEICYAARTAEELIHSVASYKPDVVIMDISCFTDHELKDIYKNKSLGDCLHYIIATKDSSVKTFQKVLDFGADCFLKKPFTQSELYSAITKSHRKTVTNTPSKAETSLIKQHRETSTIFSLISEPGSISNEELSTFLQRSKENSFQVLICEPMKKDDYTGSDMGFTEHFLSLQRNQDYLIYNYENKRQIVLLVGKAATKIVHNYFISHRGEHDRTMISFSKVFIAFGPVVNQKEDIPQSYNEALRLAERKYMLSNDIFYLSSDNTDSDTTHFSMDELKTYSEYFINDLRSASMEAVNEDLLKFRFRLQKSSARPEELKMLLCDIFLDIKQQLLINYQDVSFRIPNNYMIIYLIHNSERFDEVLDFFTMQFDSIINILKGQSRTSVFSEIINYINHNYYDSLHLEDLAEIFGYNSSYLGKMIKKKTGMTFNNYLDNVRISHAKNLLVQGNLKTYEIAERVGYHSTDYFYQKFKAATGKSPAEFRKSLKEGSA